MPKKKRKKKQPIQPTVPQEEIYLHSTLKLLATLSGILGLLLHIWTCIIVYQFEPLKWVAAFFFLFVYAEFHWAIRIHMAQGANVYSALASTWVVIHLVLVGWLIYQSRKVKKLQASN